MIGYKALNADMTSKYGNMTYELGKWYQIEGELKMCENGFHFCNTLEETLVFYLLKGSRFFKVEADGEIITTPEKNVAEKIRLVEEVQITDEMLDILVSDKNWHVRRAVAEQGRDKDLNILVNDENEFVRSAVAQCGRNKDLDILVKDREWFVRASVAEQGRGKDLDILVRDEDMNVRYAVLGHGRPQDLEILKNDADFVVAQYARRKLELKR